jgi:hypothetical protein
MWLPYIGQWSVKIAILAAGEFRNPIACVCLITRNIRRLLHWLEMMNPFLLSHRLQPFSGLILRL